MPWHDQRMYLEEWAEDDADAGSPRSAGHPAPDEGAHEPVPPAEPGRPAGQGTTPRIPRRVAYIDAEPSE